MHLSRLSLAGFKSFADLAEISFDRKLTGLIGPNGCGKSNIVEALRWGMGENSARRLRGAGMEDVIFAGTGDRAARNLAEVTLYIDNRDHQAPEPWKDRLEITVTRKIQRELGSVYRVNGREVRARDVQILFAALSSGPGSLSIVGQGRVARLIEARPEERRLLLEEAAGIRSLHHRRNEIELKLKATEANLTSLRDQMQGLLSGHTRLLHQVKQARAYRRYADRLRELERKSALATWRTHVQTALTAQTRLLEVRTRYTEARKEAETAQEALSAGESRLADQRRDLVALSAQTRQGQAAWQAQRSQLEALTQRRQFLKTMREEALKQARQAETDAQQAEEKLDKLRLEQHQEDVAAPPDREEELGQELADCRRERDRAHQEQTELAQRLAVLTAEKALREKTRQREELERTQLEKLRHQTLEKVQAFEKETQVLSSQLEAKRAESEKLAAALETCLSSLRTERAQASRFSDQLHTARQGQVQLRQRVEKNLSSQHRELAGLEAELATLQRLVGAQEPQNSQSPFQALAELIRIEPGYDMALEAALGVRLEAPIEAPASADGVLLPVTPSVFWHQLPPLHQRFDFPVETLLDKTEAPGHLQRALSQTGVIESRERGDYYQPFLKPGQVLVSKQGESWGWDGFRDVSKKASGRQARRLERERLAHLETACEEARDKLAAETQKWDATQHAANRLIDTLETALAQKHATVRQETAQETQIRQQLDGLRNGVHRMALRLGELESHLTHGKARLERYQREQAALAERHPQLAAEPEDAEPLARKHALATTQARRLNQQVEELEAEQARLLFQRAASKRQAVRLQGESAEWTERAENARTRARHHHQLAGSHATEDHPLAHQQTQLEAALAQQETIRNAQQEPLKRLEEAIRTQEQDVQTQTRACKRAHEICQNLREETIRAEEHQKNCQARTAEIEKNIRETFQALPEKLDMTAMTRASQVPPEELRAQIHRLREKREKLGEINLRAETDAQELEKELEAKKSEIREIEQAVEKFRQAMQHLDQEASQDLLAAYARIKTNFEKIYQRLFEGGEAHLTLDDETRPLEAGLEIFACPPGKRLRSMSLLSGGEQTLTALALLFAVLLSGSSLICVLDEVDAPLDDANVDLFCQMLHWLATEKNMRFLVVTHHRLTMARMDHLYGVTMPRRGSSQLLSVNFAKAMGMLDTEEMLLDESNGAG